MAVNTTMSITKNREGDDEMAKEKHIPKKLKKFRVDAGYTIYTLADKMDVNFSTISYWENGKKFPRQGKMMELEDLFGVSYRELFKDVTEEELEELENRERVSGQENKE